MVDLRATNAKLRERAIRMVRDATGLAAGAARARLEANAWSVRQTLEAHRQR
jgi:N-acetylmuramic acid 6-phosphate etherase